MNRFLMVQVNIYTSESRVLDVVVTLVSNIHMYVNKKLIVGVQLAAN